MTVAREHQTGLPISSIDLLLSKKGPGIKAIGQVLRLKDEAVKQAALEYTMNKVESGEKVTQAEATKTLSDLKAAYKKIEESKEREMSLEQKIKKLQEERDKLSDSEKEADRKWRAYQKDAMDAGRKLKEVRSEMESKLQSKQQEIKDAEEVHREHLTEMRKQIAEEERNRPRTDAEIIEHQSKLKELQDEAARAQTALNTATKEKTALERELNDLRKEMALRDKVLNDWGTASIGFREVALRLTGSADGLKSIPLTDELYAQLKMIRDLAASIVTKLDEVTHVG
jgi:chromosome segregation ATPase